MANEVARLHTDASAEYMQRFRAKQDEISNDANTARTGFTERMAELCAMQQAEIIRLNGVIKDNTVIPPRHPVSISVSTAFRASGAARNTLFAVASDKSLWMIADYIPGAPSQHVRWERVPGLPQASDEADGGQ